MKRDLFLVIFILIFAILFSVAGHFLVSCLSEIISDGDIPLTLSVQSAKNDLRNSSSLPSYSASARNSLPYWLPQL